MSRVVGIGALLAVVTVVVYAQVADFGFVAFDDDVYVSGNEHVLGGWSRESLAWAWTTGHQGNWHPLTWISHLLDVELWGADPGGHHATNLALHVVNVWLVLGLLVRATRRFWPAVVVAALFALHPLNVETVAWVSQRKTLLGTALGLGCALAYLAWVRHGGAARYALCGALLALGLLAKPLVVTLPLVFLLLDYWPLDRWRKRGPRRLLVEKLPWLALAAASSAVTLAVQAAAGAVVGTGPELGVAARLKNAVVAYAVYLKKAVWPFDLAVQYQHPDAPGGVPLGAGRLAFAALVLLAVSALVLRLARRRYLTVGWLWFLGTLVPMIGLVQVGEQALADRYAYLPLIGVFVAVAWACADLLEFGGEALRRGAALVTCVVLASFAAATWAQTRHWRDSEALFLRGLAVSPRSPLLHYNLGTVLAGEGRHVEAIEHFSRVLETGPITAQLHWALGNSLRAQRRSDEAIEHYRAALALDPGLADVHYHLGDTLRERGEVAAAIAAYRRALEIDPELLGARNNLGTALLATGRVVAAIDALGQVVRRDPSMAEAHNNLGAAWMRRNRPDRALEHFEQAARLRPEWAIPAASAARVMVTHRDPARDAAEAVRYARRASELSGHADPLMLDVLGMALALEGSYEEAARAAEASLRLLEGRGAVEGAAEVRARLERYRRGQPPP